MSSSKVAPIISKATLITKTNTQPARVTPSALGFKPYTVSSAPSTSKSSAPASKPANNVSSKDNKKNENKKVEEKLKQKAEKEAKKVSSAGVSGTLIKISINSSHTTGRKATGKGGGKAR